MPLTNKGCWSDATSTPQKRPADGVNVGFSFATPVMAQGHGDAYCRRSQSHSETAQARLEMDELTIITSDHPQGLAMAANRHSHRVRALFEPLLEHEDISAANRRAGSTAVRSCPLCWISPNSQRRARARSRPPEAIAQARTAARMGRRSRAGDRRRRRHANFVGLAFNHVGGFSARHRREHRGLCRRRFAGHRRPSAVGDIVAAAIVRIWRKNRVTPSLAEFIAQCEDARQAVSNTRRVVAKMLALLDNAEEAVVVSSGRSEAP